MCEIIEKYSISSVCRLMDTVIRKLEKILLIDNLFF